MSESPQREVVLHIGQFFFGGGHTRVRTLLGSCVAITMWHPRLRIGGMCHYLLPRPTETAHSPELGRSAEGAMTLFLEALDRTRTQPSEYVVKLFGGGCMFKTTADDTEMLITASTAAALNSIAEQNIRAGRLLLTRHGFKITAEEVGGHGSRQVMCDIWSGDVWIRRGHPLRQSAFLAAM